MVNDYAQRADNWQDPTKYDVTYYLPNASPDILVDLYTYYKGRVLLAKTLERTYRTTDATQYVEKRTDYSYNVGGGLCDNISNYEVSLITTYLSNGDISFKSIKYPTDYNNGILATLVQKNILATPIAVTTSVYNGLTTYLNEKVTEFATLADGEVQPYRTIEQRFQYPVSSITSYSGPATTDYTPYKIPQIFTYDVNGNFNRALKMRGAGLS